MKFSTIRAAVICTAAAVLIGVSYAYEKKDPSDDPRNFDEQTGDNPVLAWIFYTYQKNGFDMPTPGSTYAYSTYFSAVESVDKLQEWDLVMFTVGKDSSDGTDTPEVGILNHVDGDALMARIVWKGKGDEHAIEMSVSVDPDTIKWAMRPHKAGKAAPKASPSAAATKYIRCGSASSLPVRPPLAWALPIRPPLA